MQTFEQILDEILPGLADSFEAGNRHFREIRHSSLEDFEPLRECLAILVAEGSLIDFVKSASFQLTAQGYAKYKPRLEALRAFSR